MPRQGRKTTNIGYTKLGTRITRIVMASNPYRPFIFRSRTVINKDLLQKNPWWWITHRRGLLRRQVGADQLEARAVPKSEVKGTLPERIVLKWLINAHFIIGSDVDFQSSLDGGRLELGGLVVDFLFYGLKIIIQVQGPTHDQYARHRKDEEQRLMLEAMGYTVYFLDMELIYNEPRFDAEMRRIMKFGFAIWGGELFGPYGAPDEGNQELIEDIYVRTTRLLAVFEDANNKLIGIHYDV